MKRFTTSDGLSLAYEDDGEGQAVLCLAGLTRTHRDFDDMLPYIKGARLIRMDYRGRGESDWDPNPQNYTVPVEARDAIELLDHLGIEKAAIIGSSRGGIIGMFLAATAKERITGVLLNDVGPELDRSDLSRIASYVGRNPPWRDYLEAAAKLPDEMPGFDDIIPERWAIEAVRQWRQTPDGLVNRYDPALRITTEATLNGPEVDMWPLFDAMNGLPVALLRGENSKLLSEAAVERMMERRPDIIFAEVMDRGHIPLLDEYESLLVIDEFLASTA